MTNKTKVSQRNLNKTPLPGCNLAIEDQSIEQRLTAVGFATDETTGCMIWKGRTNERGYGVISLEKSGYHEARVHRIVFELNHPGRLQNKDVVRHLVCDTPGCGNDDHLRAGSQKQNVHDTMRAGRHFTQTPAGRRRKAIAAIHREVAKAAPARWARLAMAA